VLREKKTLVGGSQYVIEIPDNDALISDTNQCSGTAVVCSCGSLPCAKATTILKALNQHRNLGVVIPEDNPKFSRAWHERSFCANIAN
jgi:hypothetical protein